MKTKALARFRRMLSADETTLGMWVGLDSVSVSEMAVGMGLDWIVIDAEHGHLGWQEIAGHIRATVRSHTLALVRIAELNGAVIKRVLDIGADGIVIPWIETADQLSQAMRFAHYPPTGLRGIGAERATGWGERIAEHVAEAGNVLVVPIVESVTGGKNINEMLKVPGVDVFYFGPADFSSTAGFAGQWEGPGIAEAILSAKDAIRTAGRHCGVVATGQDNLTERQQQGFRMIGVGTDAGMLMKGLREMLRTAGRDQLFSFD